MATAELTRQQLLIGGAWTDAGTGNSYEQIFPYTGEPVGIAAAAGRQDARDAVAAQAAFAEWSHSTPGLRRSTLLKAADLLEQRGQEIAQIVTEETGGVFGWGMFNVALAAGMLREAAAQAYGLVGEVIPSDVPGKLAMGVRQPAGAVVAIAPWNAPVILSTRAVAMPLAYGNTVVLKASEVCPRTHAAVVHALQDAGLPPGVVNLITNDPTDAAEVVDELITHPATRRINFTGSTKVGRIIAETAGRHLKRTLLELGGKAPMVVLADADLDRAAAAASFGAFFHQGQICMSTERIVVDRSVADSLAQKLAERASALNVGDPREPTTHIGPLINDAAMERVTGLVQEAVAKGARALSGGEGRRAVLPAHRAGRRHSRHARLCRGVVRPAGRHRRGRRTRGRSAGRQRHRVRPVRGRVQRERPGGARAGPPNRERHLPRQRHHSAGRATDALRRRQGERLGPLRGQSSARRVHRAALDHRPEPGPSVPDLETR
jgi:vanillin dehydrogenase